ncbi:MAG: RsmD family RNA methyltransferase [Alphaproteobacteria bacterium]|nr:RsmD family RNA methyltransferase [Alphaproteobacteria bacterium]
MTEPHPKILIADGWKDYALLDSGDGWKLERVGPYKFARPEPQALWRAQSNPDKWQVDARFSPAADEAEEMGRWRTTRDIPESWPIRYRDIAFHARCTPFRHLGFFPEQAVHWNWANEHITPGAQILNLFGYTGVASLMAAAAGAQVTHVDASKKAIGFARQNQDLAKMTDAPIRWIADDALAFVKREARRGKKYDGIILDPPKHGRGPNGEIWRLDEQLLDLLSSLRPILADQGERPTFVIATLYALRLSHLALSRTLADALQGLGGQIEAGEMALREEKSDRLLPTALFARWNRPPGIPT